MKAKTIALEALIPGLAGPLCTTGTAAPAPAVECCYV